MPDRFSYTAMEASGRRHRGREAAASADALQGMLEARGLLVLTISPAEEGGGSRSGSAVRVSRRELLDTTRAMAALLPAGLPVVKALEAAIGVSSAGVTPVLEAVRTAVLGGETLGEALGRHPEAFPPFYIGLIRAGERSGDLAGAFRRLGEQLEREEQIRQRLLSASLYPLLLLVAGGAAVLVLLLLVIPRFVELLQGTGAALPRSTAIVLALSTGLRKGWPLLACAPIPIVGFMAWARHTTEGRQAWARLLLRVPLVRTVRQNALGARFARLLGTLLGGGAPLLAALNDTIASLDDPVARDEVNRIRDRIREGAALHRAIQDGGLFPPVLVQLVTVGETSGQLQSFLERAATMLEDRTDRLLQRLVALVEPVMILLFGGVVGFVALSLLQAIYSVNAGSFR